jgi:hypothetical protein
MTPPWQPNLRPEAHLFPTHFPSIPIDLHTLQTLNYPQRSAANMRRDHVVSGNAPLSWTSTSDPETELPAAGTHDIADLFLQRLVFQQWPLAVHLFVELRVRYGRSAVHT